MTLEQIDAKIKRWQTRVKRATNALDKLLKQRRRLERKLATPPKVRHLVDAPYLRPETKQATPPPVTPPVTQADDLKMPDFLRRDKAAADAVRQEVEATKLAKARGRIAKMKAKRSGETKRMPLSGKAALDFIRSGK